MSQKPTYYVRALKPNGELRSGMYSSGDRAMSPEIAKQVTGSLRLETGEKMVVIESRQLPGWTDSAGNQHPRYEDGTIIEIVQ